MATIEQLQAALESANNQLAEAVAQKEYYTSLSIKLENGEYYTRAKQLVAQFIEQGDPATSTKIDLSDLPISKIANEFFAGCTNLTTLVLPTTLQRIGYDAFSNCEKLTEINIPDSCTHIDSNAFRYCYVATTIKLPSLLTYLGSHVFEFCNKVRSIEIPELLDVIDANAFYGCQSCTTIAFAGSRVTYIANYAFYDCNKVTAIDLASQKSLTNVGKYAFANCMAMTSLTLPVNSTTKMIIDNNAFSGCSKLTTLDIPANCVGIGEYAFSGCAALTKLTIRGTVGAQGSTVGSGQPVIRNGAFSGCPTTCAVEFAAITSDQWRSSPYYPWGFASGTKIKFADATITV